MKKFLCLFLSLAMLLGITTGLNLTASAEPLTGSCGENVTYSLDAETGTLTISGTGDMKNYHSYDEDDDIENPFDCYFNKIKTIIIEDGVTSIGASAFSNASSLTSVTIPNTVTSIGVYAFHDCESLTSVTIPDSVTIVDKSAFSYCTGLTSVTIPNSLTRIGQKSFSGCTGLTSVTIPNSVTHIGQESFSGCTGLTSVTIPNSVTSIGQDAFSGCTGLTSVTIPDSVTRIGQEAFSRCVSLTEINVDSNNANYSSQNGVLFNKDKTKLIQYPIGNSRKSYSVLNGTTNIGDFSFYDCINLISVTMPNRVKNIGRYAFSGCENLTNVIIPDSVTGIGDSAFAGCTNLKSIAIPNGVTHIDDSTFYGCENLTDIAIPVSVTYIGVCVFTDCNNLSVHYSGTKKQWDKIFIDDWKHTLNTDATIYYNEKISQKQQNTKVKKAKGSKKALAISWSKVKGVKGYEIQFATDKSFKKNVKSKTINKQKTTKTTIKNLKCKTKYYVRIRTYKMSKGTKIYSTWSSTKTVKTK